MLRQSGDLTLSDTPLPAAMFSISEIWKINLVVGQDVQGRVNGVFRDAPLYEILDSILLSQGYGYRPVGRSLVILPLKELGDLNPMFESATITLRYADPAEALESLRMLNSPQGKMPAVRSARSLMVLDFPDRVAMMRQFVQGLDRAAGEFRRPPNGVRRPLNSRPSARESRASASSHRQSTNQSGRCAAATATGSAHRGTIFPTIELSFHRVTGYPGLFFVERNSFRSCVASRCRG